MYKLTDNIHVFEREDWGAADGLTMARQALPTEAFLHHGAESDAEQVDHFEEQCQKMRATQNYHMEIRGWSDIAYHYVVFQPYGNIPYTRIFEGRYVKWVPAAQEGHNSGTAAICVYGNFTNDDFVKANTRHAIRKLLTELPSMTGLGKVRTLGGHRDVVQTECPGDTLYAQIDRIISGTDIKRYK